MQEADASAARRSHRCRLAMPRRRCRCMCCLSTGQSLTLDLLLSPLYSHSLTHTITHKPKSVFDPLSGILVILICITDIHPLHACMHVLHINTDTHTHRDWWNPYSNGSYVTGIRNQYLPRWCGTCWTQDVTSALSDRLKILRIRTGTNLADGLIKSVYYYAKNLLSILVIKRMKTRESTPTLVVRGSLSGSSRRGMSVRGFCPGYI